MITISTTAHISEQQLFIKLKGVPEGDYKVVVNLEPQKNGHKRKPPKAGFSKATFEMSPDFNASLEDLFFGDAPPFDNLTVIEGIGPILQYWLNSVGIMTYAQLVVAPEKDIQTALNKAGADFQDRDPGSWKLQAELAAKGDWAALEKWKQSQNENWK